MFECVLRIPTTIQKFLAAKYRRWLKHAIMYIQRYNRRYKHQSSQTWFILYTKYVCNAYTDMYIHTYMCCMRALCNNCMYVYEMKIGNFHQDLGVDLIL